MSHPATVFVVPIGMSKINWQTIWFDPNWRHQLTNGVITLVVFGGLSIIGAAILVIMKKWQFPLAIFLIVGALAGAFIGLCGWLLVSNEPTESRHEKHETDEGLIGIKGLALRYTRGTITIKGRFENPGKSPLTMAHVATVWYREKKLTEFLPPKPVTEDQLHYLTVTPNGGTTDLLFDVPITEAQYESVMNRTGYLYLSIGIVYDPKANIPPKSHLFEYEPSVNRFRGTPFLSPAEQQPLILKPPKGEVMTKEEVLYLLGNYLDQIESQIRQISLISDSKYPQYHENKHKETLSLIREIRTILDKTLGRDASALFRAAGTAVPCKTKRAHLDLLAAKKCEFIKLLTDYRHQSSHHVT